MTLTIERPSFELTVTGVDSVAREILSPLEITEGIGRMAASLSMVYKDVSNTEGIIIAPLLQGGLDTGLALRDAMYFERPRMTIQMDGMRASSYKGTDSTGTVEITSDITRDVAGRHLLVVDDILDTGKTLRVVGDQLKLEKPASLRFVTLLRKDTPRRAVGILSDLVVESVFDIDDFFVVGFGLDYNGEHRKKPGVYRVDPLEDLLHGNS